MTVRVRAGVQPGTHAHAYEQPACECADLGVSVFESTGTYVMGVRAAMTPSPLMPIAVRTLI